MFDSSKDLSRGLSRGENLPPENVQAHTEPSVYTAYTQPAGTSYNTISPQNAAPVVSNDVNEPPKSRKHRRSFTVALIVLAVIVCAGGVFALRYKVDITRTFSGFTMDIYRRGSEKAENRRIPDFVDPENRSTGDLAELVNPTESGVRLNFTGTSGRQNGGELSFSDIYEKCAPSVVSIEARTYSGNYSGTGVVVLSDGTIVTNAHVVENTFGITVTTVDGKSYPAYPVGTDTESDLAVIRIEAEGLTPAEFGDSDQLRVGDEVAAIGNPFSQSLTMTNGIISAINRNINYNGSTMTLIQTNAAINEGNSGGPLINMYGQVIGITNMKLVSHYTQVDGIGYAIPSATAKTVVNELIDHGYVSGRPGIGISLDEIPESALIYYGLPRGVYIRSVQENSDAFEKGIRSGDMITAVNGIPVSSSTEINEIKNRCSVGDSIELTIFRDGVYYAVEIILMDMGMFD